MSRRSKSGIVNVRMVITEEKILSNIDKVQKLINPKSKKQIVQFEDDTYFKDLIESIKAYLIEYPKKKNFPVSVYKAAYELVEFATNQFEENTKKVEELIRQREENIALAGQLKDLIEAVENKTDDWKDRISEAEEEGKFSEDVIDTLKLVGKDKTRKSQNYQDAIKLLNARTSLFYYEDIRIYRDHKNMVNRLNNCEIANQEKTFRTGQVQLENINYLKDHDLFGLLEENTRIVADARVKYPEVSMQELADIVTLENNYKIGKSGVNHHFIKINNLVKRHKERSEDNGSKTCS